MISVLQYSVVKIPNTDLIDHLGNNIMADAIVDRLTHGIIRNASVDWTLNV